MLGVEAQKYIYKNNHHIIQSFQLGAVRSMLNKDKKSEWERLREWLSKQNKVDTLVGLGGSIKSFLNIIESKKISTKIFKEEADKLKRMSQQDKIDNLGLQPDRADVIDYALNIYFEIINNLNVQKIKSTKWGVSDSMAVKTFHELYSKKISIYKD